MSICGTLKEIENLTHLDISFQVWYSQFSLDFGLAGVAKYLKPLNCIHQPGADRKAAYLVLIKEMFSNLNDCNERYIQISGIVANLISVQGAVILAKNEYIRKLQAIENQWNNTAKAFD